MFTYKFRFAIKHNNGDNDSMSNDCFYSTFISVL